MTDSEWISATETRNFASSDQLLDWLNLYGDDRGFVRDQDYDDYDERTDFSLFIMRKGIEFETAVAKHLSTLTSLERPFKEGERGPTVEVFERTKEAMVAGEPIIYQGRLRHEASGTYGIADFLVRSDTLLRLFPTSITEENSKVPAPELGENPWHYRVIDAKFTTLHFLANGSISPRGSAWAYMLQVYIYNRALGELQGYTPPGGYLLGRKWEQTVKGEKLRSNDCMDRLAFVPHDFDSRGKGSLSSAVEQACNWIRRVRTEGKSWRVVPEPSVPELRPNVGSTSDQPWHHAKTEINQILRDLTVLWGVGVSKRNDANRAGIYQWTDGDYSAEDVGVKGSTTGRILQSIIDINRNPDSVWIMPPRITGADQSWREKGPVEFYVDFETVSDLYDDFSLIPLSGGQPLIFMIGCGHEERGKWRWTCFVTDALTQDSEAHIIEQWLKHMEEVRNRLNPGGENPRVFHWSQAEQSVFETAFNSAKNRHHGKEWPSPNWYDFLKKVIQKEPVVIRGSFGFGLKSVATSLKKHGAIDTVWDAGPADGLGAMVGAWWSAARASELGVSMKQIQLVKDIGSYNEVDCKVMMEIIGYLRTHH